MSDPDRPRGQPETPGEGGDPAPTMSRGSRADVERARPLLDAEAQALAWRLTEARAEGPPLGREPLSPTEMYAALTSRVAFREGVRDDRLLRHGSATRVMLQLIDQDGQRVTVVFASNQGGRHAEEHAIDMLRLKIRQQGVRVAGGKLLVVVNQTICSDRCVPALRRLAEELDLETVEGFLVVRHSVRSRGRTVRPRSTFATQVSPSVSGLSPQLVKQSVYIRSGGGSPGARLGPRPRPEAPRPSAAGRTASEATPAPSEARGTRGSRGSGLAGRSTGAAPPTHRTGGRGVARAPRTDARTSQRGTGRWGTGLTGALSLAVGLIFGAARSEAYQRFAGDLRALRRRRAARHCGHPIRRDDVDWSNLENRIRIVYADRPPLDVCLNRASELNAAFDRWIHQTYDFGSPGASEFLSRLTVADEQRDRQFRLLDSDFRDHVTYLQRAQRAASRHATRWRAASLEQVVRLDRLVEWVDELLEGEVGIHAIDLSDAEEISGFAASAASAHRSYVGTIDRLLALIREAAEHTAARRRALGAWASRQGQRQRAGH